MVTLKHISAWTKDNFQSTKCLYSKIFFFHTKSNCICSESLLLFFKQFVRRWLKEEATKKLWHMRKKQLLLGDMERHIKLLCTCFTRCCFLGNKKINMWQAVLGGSPKSWHQQPHTVPTVGDRISLWGILWGVFCSRLLEGASDENESCYILLENCDMSWLNLNGISSHKLKKDRCCCTFDLLCEWRREVVTAPATSLLNGTKTKFYKVCPVLLEFWLLNFFLLWLVLTAHVSLESSDWFV